MQSIGKVVECGVGTISHHVASPDTKSGLHGFGYVRCMYGGQVCLISSIWK